ncbi:NitT/TauT family transport system ATP-binding protein [Caloramator quimbayensis]|uniref:NitT/TauT family transport system ATP-binding protein n=1 Tax=Caloramator quimbayensis TaxID=1147123 RepID=A0A1T4XE98_9CLOT|nr:ABC transporter ATP-binding protein [Caloramator quimbayensis]SKA87884.1 NitT/TauT family transport system ATP-binding protein [Caloramator quimbayensis]
MIKIESLTVKYGSFTALSNINLEIGDDEIYAVLGPSGCGKTTLIYALSMIIKEFEGRVLINDKPIKNSDVRIGTVLQNYGLLPWKNVYENALLGIEIKDKEKADKLYSEYIIKELGLEDLKYKYPNSLSGGQMQRVALARSFILKPQILLMDEPFSALDAITREKMQELFLNIWMNNKVSTVFVTHSIEEAICIGKKIVILSKSPGRILKIINNPLFGLKEPRLSSDFYNLSLEIRKFIKEGWSIEK